MKEGWEYKEFEDCLVKAAKAKQVKTSDYNTGSKYPIISQEDKMISGYCDDSSLLYHIDCPVVIFGDHTRVLKYVDFDFVVGADGVKILVPKDFLNARFLLYYLQWYKVPSLGYSRHYKLLKEINLPIPPLAEQERIVAELDLLSSIIEKKKAQLKELDQLAQSIFYDMFGDPITNEKGWDVKKLGEVTTQITDGSHNPPKGLDYSEYPMLSSKNIFFGYYNYDSPRYLSKEDFEIENKRTNISNGDVLLTIVGTVGRTCCIKSPFIPFTLQRSVAVLKPKHEVLLSVHLMFFLNSLSDLWNREAKGVAQKGIYLKQLAMVPVTLPPLPLQQEFASKVEAIERQKSLIQQSIVETQTLFDSRMDHWFG